MDVAKINEKWGKTLIDGLTMQDAAIVLAEAKVRASWITT